MTRPKTTNNTDFVQVNLRLPSAYVDFAKRESEKEYVPMSVYLRKVLLERLRDLNAEALRTEAREAGY